MRRFLSTALLLVAAAACTDDEAMPVAPEFAEVAANRAEAATGMAASALYRVTVTNLTTGQPFTPPLAAVHRQATRLFEAGDVASHGLQQIAENGNLAPMLSALGSNKHVGAVVVTEGPTLPPLLPGESLSFDIEGKRGARYLSVLSMLICTNDGFMGVNSVRLPQEVGGIATRYAGAYDAGTEINTEDFADLVPPCPALTGVMSGDPGTGMSDPALAEGGTVRVHPGIAGDDDLDAGIHGWMDPVARVEIERIG